MLNLAAIDENKDLVTKEYVDTGLSGKADSSHTHAAGDVTSGTFAAARIPSLAASKITSGTLATARGGVPTGGTAGQVLTKNSATNNDVVWTTPSGGGTTVDIPTGSITMFAGSTAPTGYLICDGSAVSRTTYSALFAVIGTTYGSGDGSTTFNLPNLQGKFALGKNSSYALGSTGGAATVTLTTNQIPAHTHGSVSLTGWAKMWGNTGFIGRGGSADWGGIIKPGDYWYGNSPAEDTGWQSSSLEIDASHEHSSVGGGASHNNMPPYQTVNYIIKT